MNITEQAVLKGIRNTMLSLRAHEKGDDWEQYAKRMQAFMRTNVAILDELLKLEPTSDPEETEEGVKL